MDNPHPGQTVFPKINSALVAGIFKHRDPLSHKGDHGHALLIAGSKGKMGAAVIAARACCRSGAGLTSIFIPEAERAVLQQAIPEAMLLFRKPREGYKPYASVGIGPGIGTSKAAQQLLKDLLESYDRPVLLDADALNILSKKQSWLKKIPAGSVITPHPKEFDRLFGDVENADVRRQKALQLSLQYPFVIVLKDHQTLVAFKGKGWLNTTGNAGLAKGGSGDMLSGIITALLAEKYLPEDAARLGVFLHGLAADLCLQQQSPETMLATDVIEYLPGAFRLLDK
ncbi:MAG: epimerase [Ferruginibacter sp.]|nr:epimerase [Ferruginibacter sp.]